MLCRYVAAFATRGIAHEDGELLLYSDSETSIVLTKNSAALLHDADRGAALSYMMLRGLYDAGDLDQERLDREVAAIAERREKRLRGASQLVVTANRTVEPTLDGPKADLESFSLCWDAVDKNKVISDARPVVYRALASVMLTSRGSPALDHLAEAVYLIESGDHILYSLSSQLTATGVASYKFSEEDVELANESYRAISSSDLDSVCRLLRYSADSATDEFQAFLTAFNALEVLVGKLFKAYTKECPVGWEKALRPGYKDRFVTWATCSSTRSPTLADRFQKVASFLEPQPPASDFETFKRLKDLRDNLAHGRPWSGARQETRDALSLTLKYLRLHLRYVSKICGSSSSELRNAE